LTTAADSRLAWPVLASVTVAGTAAVTGATAAVTGATAAFTGAATAVTGAAAAFAAETTVFTGAAAEVTDVTVGTTEPLVTARVVVSSAFPAPATVAVTAGVRAWPT
jgi:hypothetical protein